VVKEFDMDYNLQGYRPGPWSRTHKNVAGQCIVASIRV